MSTKQVITYILSGSKQEQVKEHGFEALSFETNSVEKLFSEDLPDASISVKGIKEIERVLKPGGRIELYDTKKSCSMFSHLCEKLGMQYCNMRKNEKGYVVSGVKPYVMDMTEEKLAVGLEIQSSASTLIIRVSHLCKKYAKIKYYENVSCRIEPRIFYACYHFPKEKKAPITYFLGEGVTKVENLPDEAVAYNIPKGKYVVFTVIPGSLKKYTKATLAMKRYAYNYWIKKSSYERQEDGMDIEFYDERSEDPVNGEFEVWIPLKDRKGDS